MEPLASILRDWERLSHGAVMRRPSWLLPWWFANQSNHRLHVLVAYKNEEVVGMMPLVETQSAWTGCTLVFMGSGKACSDDVGILCDEQNNLSVAIAFLKFLFESPGCAKWDHLNLDGIREDNACMNLFAEQLTSIGNVAIQRKTGPNCWAASLEGGLDTYLNRLSKRARKILRDAKNECTLGNSSFQVASTLDQAQSFLREIAMLHQARWKERGIEGCFGAEPFSQFLNGAITDLWNDPWQSPVKLNELAATSTQRVHVALLKIQDQSAAGAICILDRDSLDIYLTGMNPQFADVRPGFQLLQGCIEHAIQLGCKRIDFLRGDEEYKERLGGQPSVQQRWIVPSARWSSRLRSVAYKTASGLKTWWTTPSLNEPRVQPALATKVVS
jgi:CelD/BcsL family acetyltransferase involved in cellulose biosynthesis